MHWVKLSISNHSPQGWPFSHMMENLSALVLIQSWLLQSHEEVSRLMQADKKA